MGANVGNVKQNLLRAQDELEKRDIRITNRSRIYKTKPWGDNKQPDYLNVALEVESDYAPSELLIVLKDIETCIGRKRNRRRWGPRKIDIDILFYGNQVIISKDLIIPHKEFFNRPFAMKLLAEIAPDFIPPHSDKCLKEHLNGADGEGLEIYCD